MAAGLQEEKCPFLSNFVWQKSYLNDDTYKHLVAITSVISITVLPIILLNAAVIYTVATKRRLRTNSNVLVACLAGQDLFTGLVVQPFTIALEIERIHGDGPFCTLEKITVVAFGVICFLSLFHILIVCIDRYVATKHPMRYDDIVTTKRLKIGVLSVWGLTLLLFIPMLALAVGENDSKLYSLSLGVLDKILVTTLLVSIVLILYAYHYIYSEAKRQERRLQTEQLPHEEVKRLKKGNKAAFTLAFILGALVLTYLPVIISSVVTIYGKICLSVANILWSWSLTFISLGSLCNPIVYFWRIKKLRNALLEILHLNQSHNSSLEMEIQVTARHRCQVAPTP